MNEYKILTNESLSFPVKFDKKSNKILLCVQIVTGFRGKRKFCANFY